MELIWLIFDYLGTIAFALSGVLVGMQRRMDIFGIAMLALATAVGGGMIRDTLVGNVPPAALKNPVYISISLLTTILLFTVYRTPRSSKTRRNKLWIRFYHMADTLGLASFTVTGAMVGLAADPRSLFLLPMALAMITACGGGILRDICASKIPVVFRADVYASASLTGAFVFCILRELSTLEWAAPIAFLTVVMLRVLALRYHWRLPS